MVRAEIIAIGSELLLGGVADTNSLYLADELLKVGIQVRYKTVVGDDTKDIEAVLQHAVGRAEGGITTGGLGPAQGGLDPEGGARRSRRRRGTAAGAPTRLAPRPTGPPLPKNGREG